MRDGKVDRFASLALLLLTANCATAPLLPAGSLSSYQSLVPSNGILTHSRLMVTKDAVLAAKTIAIVPTSFSASAAQAGLSQSQRTLVANVIDRSMCIALSNRFQIVPVNTSADLTVHAVVTYVTVTDEYAAGLSRAVSVGGGVAEKLLTTTPIPVPIPRIPIGLGALSVEAEARDPAGRQDAAMIWARGADAFTSKPKVAKDGDAYDLAKYFAVDFSRVLVTGKSPFKRLPPLPSAHDIASRLGAAPKDVGCDAFGRGPGVAGLVGDMIGLPPEWTDKGAPAVSQPVAHPADGASPPTSDVTY